MARVYSKSGMFSIFSIWQMDNIYLGSHGANRFDIAYSIFNTWIITNVHFWPIGE